MDGLEEVCGDTDLGWEIYFSPVVRVLTNHFSGICKGRADRKKSVGTQTSGGRYVFHPWFVSSRTTFRESVKVAQIGTSLWGHRLSGGRYIFHPWFVSSRTTFQASVKDGRIGRSPWGHRLRVGDM